MNKLTAIFVCAAAALCATSCSDDRNGWTINGKIDGASEQTIFIDQFNETAWITVDSLKTDDNGTFEYVAVDAVPKGTQPLYRVRLNDKTIVFTVDSTATVTLTANAKDFGKKHRLTGNSAVTRITTADSLINAAVDRVGTQAAVNDSLLINELFKVINTDSTCIASYYILTRTIDNRPIFTSDSKLKINIIGAVATKYEQLRPNDPRGKKLATLYKELRKLMNPEKRKVEVQADETGRPNVDYTRPDYKGTQQSLNAILDRGGVTILYLSRFDAKGSAANTAALGQAYNTYKDKGLQIYQVGFEPNEALWRQNAATMPWIAVYNGPTDLTLPVAYNANPVNGDPVSFIFNANGELVTRVANPADLAAELAKLL